MQSLFGAARRAGDYADLLVDVAAEMRATLKFRIELLTGAIVLAVAGIVSIWATIVLYAWDLPSRNTIAMLMAALLTAAAVLCAWLAVRGVKRGPGEIRLAHQLRLDRERLDSWSHSPAATPAESAPWAPRSRIMRAVMNPDYRPAFMAAAALASLAFPQLPRAQLLRPLVSRIASAVRHLSKMRLRG
jgi:uncharacterized membrane protein YqjE